MTISTPRQFVFVSALLLGPLAPGPETAGQGIHEAVLAGDQAQVQAFLAQDPGLLEAINDRGLTPLSMAVVGGNEEMMSFLLDAGADPLAPAAPITPVDLAFQQDCQRRGTGRTSFFLTRGVAFDPDSPVMGRPKLHLAVPLGNEEMIRLLLDLGADTSARGPGGGRSWPTLPVEAGSNS
jgi:ankyrin repeat protein